MDIAPTKRNFILAVIIIILLVIANWYISIGQNSRGRVIQTLKVPNGNEAAPTVITDNANTQIQQPQSQTSTFSHFHDRGYDLQYPKNWTAEYANTLNMVHFYNQSDKVSISLYEKASPFPDFSGNVTQQNSINLSVNGQTYNTTEYILNGRSLYINLDIPDAKQHSILIGSDYPAKARGTLDDYYREKNTVLKILESIRYY